MTDLMINRLGGLASVQSWRRQATALRELAERSYQEPTRQMLFREADAADRQANSWLDAAITT